MRTNYLTEKEGQFEFYQEFCGLSNAQVQKYLLVNSDGIWNGNLLEFKLNVQNIDKDLSQCIIYLSKLRLKGIPLPANILLISLNQGVLYLFRTDNYLKEIHIVYNNSASHGIKKFTNQFSKIDYNFTDINNEKKIKLQLKEKGYVKVDVDINNVVALANIYYQITKKRKVDFMDELRNPSDLYWINSYQQNNNSEFRFVLDLLNDKINKKELGAFYTPKEYAIKSIELVRKAISLVPDGNDYIILDRCAGSGNLERYLTEEELDHCILSTFEYIEWIELYNEFNDRVRYIIPPVKPIYNSSDVDSGLIVSADALNKAFIDNAEIKRYLNNPKCSIILFENPPYRDETSGMTGIKAKGKKTKSFILEEMVKNGISKTNELANQFIWSGINYYLRQETDSYVLYSPVKYWKLDKLVDRYFGDGFVFNREHFHASKSAVSCIWWQNKPEDRKGVLNQIPLGVYNIVDNNLKYEREIFVKRCDYQVSVYFDKTTYPTDVVDDTVVSGNGYESFKKVKGIYNNNIVAYITGAGFGISHPQLNFNLLTCTCDHKHGFYLRDNNWYEKLPILAVKNGLCIRKWFENELICCSADLGNKYTQDSIFLQNCFIFACLCDYNKCLSFESKKGRLYLNKLCFDYDTLAMNKLKTMTLSTEDNKLIDAWNKVLSEAKSKSEYIPTYRYGTYQISKEINTFTRDVNGKRIFNYPTLNTNLINLKKIVNDYFERNILQKLYDYELLK
ncbi:MAG: hypothetical protein LBV58_01605 [Acholeplasmatales bacterium]|jgi:uncharacterized protein YegP (UPF0339 family)|nr:hypothetical protein [Acholeplasmatales bacterium]